MEKQWDRGEVGNLGRGSGCEGCGGGNEKVEVGMREWMRRSTYEQEEVVEDGLDIIIKDGMKRGSRGG